MQYLMGMILVIIIQGCALKSGDMVEYQYKEYSFMKDMFFDNKLRCVELGNIKNTQLNVKYCKSINYARIEVEGFVFLHKFEEAEDRFIAAKLYLKTPRPLMTSCSSEVLNQAKSGEEYIICMVAKNEFKLSEYLISQPKDIEAKLSTPLGNRSVFGGTITDKAKILIRNLVENNSSNDFATKSL